MLSKLSLNGKLDGDDEDEERSPCGYKDVPIPQETVIAGSDRTFGRG